MYILNKNPHALIGAVTGSADPVDKIGLNEPL
jgi:hypothetical protein